MLAHQVAARTAEQNEKTSQKLDALWQQRNTEHQQIQARANKDTLVQLRRLSAERASRYPRLYLLDNLIPWLVSI